MDERIKEIKKSIEELTLTLGDVDVSTLEGIETTILIGNEIKCKYEEMRKIRVRNFNILLRKKNTPAKTIAILDLIDVVQREYSLDYAMSLYYNFVNFEKEDGEYDVVDSIEVDEKSTVDFIQLTRELENYDWDDLTIDIKHCDGKFTLNVGILREEDEKTKMENAILSREFVEALNNIKF